MIYIYPMLTSKSVSNSILPGICKLLERYLLVYGMDTILKTFSVANIGDIAKKSGLYNIGKNEKIKLEQQKEQFPIPPYGGFRSSSDYKGKQKDSDKEKDDLSIIAAKTGEVWDYLSIEPTWFIVKGGLVKGDQMIGVKVVPFFIENVSNVVGTLMKDKASDTIQFLSRKYGRMFARLLFMSLRTLKTPGLPSLTADPKRDILFGQSKYGTNVFLCLSKLDFPDSDILVNQKIMSKLFSMGWTSIIIADDVDKEATFCMKEYGGLCSILNYGYIYSTLGKSHSEVFKNITDVKKSAAPFFNKRIRMTKVLGEAIAARKMGDMLIRRKKREVLVEDINSFVDIHKSSIMKKIKEIRDGIAEGNLNKIRLASVGLPEPPFDSMIREKEVQDNYKFAKKVLKNSTDYSDTTIHRIASVIAIGSKFTDNPIESTKKGLKLFSQESSVKKKGMALVKYILWAGYAYIVGVLLKSTYSQFKTFSIRNILKSLSPFELSSKMSTFVSRNWILFLILGIIYILSDMVKHKEEFGDETK